MINRTVRQKQQIEEDLSKQESELNETAQKLEDTKRRLDKQGKAQQTFERYILKIISDLGASKTEYATYAEALSALSAAKDKFTKTAITEARKEAQEAAEADFQKREDALEAQKVVLADLQELKERLEKFADTDTSRKRFMMAHKFRDGRTLEDAYQQSVMQQKERTEAILQKATELTAQYDAMKSQDVQAELN